MTEHLLEIKILQPGRVTGQYYAVDSSTLRLERIVYPDETLPFDVGILPTALTAFEEPFAVLVLGSLSHPANTEIESRLLGGLQRNAEAPVLLVDPVSDEQTIHCLDELNDKRRTEIVATLYRTYPGEWQWLTASELESQLHIATLRYRQREARGKHREVDPAWKPLYVNRPIPSFTEVEHYTPAEYTFFELPHRFQYYVNEHLAPDERILYALRRPAMSSRRKRSWFHREQLQEGVLILTDQRLIHLAELVPPDSANIRYGFHTSVGVLERLVGTSVSPLNNESLLLTTTWNAQGGQASIEWEVPNDTQTALDELTTLLDKFIVDDPNAYQLCRAGFPKLPDVLPPLMDTASSDPDNLIPTNEHFSASLSVSLAPNEKAYTWAFLPEWFDRKNGAQVLVVTNQRIFLLPNHSLNISLGRVATLEYTGSILRSSLAINYFDGGKIQRNEIFFPYPAQDAFRNCFESARRCMAVIPL